jgi:hypothetical protein
VPGQLDLPAKTGERDRIRECLSRPGRRAHVGHPRSRFRPVVLLSVSMVFSAGPVSSRPWFMFPIGIAPGVAWCSSAVQLLREQSGFHGLTIRATTPAAICSVFCNGQPGLVTFPIRDVIRSWKIVIILAKMRRDIRLLVS